MEYLTLALNVAPMIVMVASAIAAVTPTNIDNRAVHYFRRFVDVLAINVGNAKNAADVLREQSRGPRR